MKRLPPPPPFTPQELLELTALRARYDQDCGCFSRREQARLRFWRWLYQTGRLASTPDGNELPGSSEPEPCVLATLAPIQTSAPTQSPP